MLSLAVVLLTPSLLEFCFGSRNSLQQVHCPASIPVRHCTPHNRVAPPVIVWNMVPVFSVPPRPSPQPPLVMRPQALGAAPPVSVRQAVPAFSALVCKELPRMHPVVKPEDPRISRSTPAQVEEPPSSRAASVSAVPDSEVPAIQVGLPSYEVFTVQLEPVAKNPTL